MIDGKIKEVLLWAACGKCRLDEDTLRRIMRYSYAENTKIGARDGKTVVSTEINIKGIYNTLTIFPDGSSRLSLDFEDPLF